MRTEHSWTELRRGAADLGALLAFRRSGLTATTARRLRVAALAVGVLTCAAIAVPALLREPLEGQYRGDLVAVLPTLYLGFLLLTVLASTSTGGGREVIPREQAVGYPISSVTEHLGALLLAPLNIAWVIQAWTLLGVTAYVLGPAWLPLAILPVLAWILAATAIGQFLGWVFEGIRRGPRGVLLARTISGLLALGAAVLVMTDRLVPLLDRSPTVQVYLAAGFGNAGEWSQWALRLVVLLALAAAAIAAGLVPARWALERPQREELRLESGIREARANPASDLAAMIRLDRASIWRSVPLRRGLLVLALMPGGIVVAGDLTWDLVVIIPGLVASGAALLFGINAWCLDGRGALWRDSLPADPAIAYYAKVIVLAEVTLAAAAPTVLVAGIRAGAPSSAELASVLAATLVVAAQVVAASLRWSVTRPYAMDLRSARATPAPPVVMAGYSARLALRTTIIGLLFSATTLADDWVPAAVLALPLGFWAAYRIEQTGSEWARPLTRARVVAVVAT